MTTTSLRWYPVGGGSPLIFDRQGPFVWNQWHGYADTLVSPLTVKGPGQRGDTLLDVAVAPRVIGCELTVVGSTRADYLARVRELARAFVAEPAEPGETVSAGLLQYLVDGVPLCEIPAVPRGGPEVQERAHHGLVDLEYHCSDPFWRDVADSSQAFDTAIGTEYPLEYPFEYIARTLRQTVMNAGDVSVPVLIRVFGEITEPVITNRTTGKVLSLSGTIESGEYLEINTRYGEKKIEKVTIATGVRENAMDRLVLEDSDFWQLKPGSNVVQFDATSNVDGVAVIFWRQAYAAPPVIA